MTPKLTPAQFISTVLYPSVQESDGTYSTEFVKIYGTSSPGLAHRIHIGLGENVGFEITPAEAHEVAAALLATADQM